MIDRRLIETEGLLVRRNRWFLSLVLLLLVVPVFAGTMNTYSFVKHELVTMESFRSVYHDQFREWVLQSEDNRFLREALSALHPAGGSNYFLSILAILGSMFAPLWSAHFVGSELGWRTSRVRAIHVGWQKVVLAKLTWITIINLLLSIVFSIVGTIVGYIAWSIALRSLWIAPLIPAPELSVSLLQQILVTVLGLTLYGFLGAAGALLTRSSLAGAILGLAAPYIEWMVLGAPRWGWMLPRIAYGNLLSSNFRYFVGGFASEPAGLVQPPFAWLNWVTLIVWWLLLGSLTVSWAKRQEIH